MTDRPYSIAIYMRVSKADKSSQEQDSSSIRSQRLLLREYVGGHFQDYRLLEYVDDGYSGTNMNRPGVTAMLERVREQTVDCIVVKDFSRFSRDYIELGAHMEQIFPFMGVRFISIGDHYDSLEQRHSFGSPDTSFKSLMYDLYSKDLSVKVKSSLKVKKDRGEYISVHAPFGYGKAPEDRHMLVVDEEEAEVVRRIFDMTLAGRTSCHIAKVLNAEGVKTPIQFQMAKGRAAVMPKGGQFFWSTSAVCEILRNRVYAGDMVYGKYGRDGAGGRKHLKPRSEWKICRNHHEPIIERDVFEMVQAGRGKERPKRKRGKNPLTGKLVCGGCGRSLQIKYSRNPYYQCPLVYMNGRKDCIRRADAMCLEQVVLFRMQEKMRRAGVGREMDLAQKMPKKSKAEWMEKRNPQQNLLGEYACPELVELSEDVVEELIKEVVVRRETDVEVIWKKG